MVRQPSPPATILVVDDDPAMRILLADLLRKNGFHARGVASGAEACDDVATGDVDLILLDVMMPGMSGFDVCRALRRDTDGGPPIIMVSARGEEADRVAGLELGADDYIAKPFAQSELLARVRAVLRRGTSGRAAGWGRPQRLTFLGWIVDLRRREVFTPSGARVDLSGAEFDLLVALLERPQRVIGRAALLEMSRVRLGSPSDRSVDVLISRLRGKLEGEDAGELIRTVRGAGYMFVPDVEQA
ncbi:MAG: DNA-binding response regulator [Phenylobacterium sp. SCN 70-31]|nr:response regulator transcription factor [Phenylobacterium sp. SCN 70-31]ODT86604.1 MAG: DNA-binding response regulator [Phenylobacterium sp. SCN 70-31]